MFKLQFKNLNPLLESKINDEFTRIILKIDGCHKSTDIGTHSLSMTQKIIHYLGSPSEL